MNTFTLIIALLVVIWVFIYTVSFGIWTWKHKNRPGAIMVFVIALASVVLPVYTLFLKGT